MLGIGFGLTKTAQGLALCAGESGPSILFQTVSSALALSRGLGNPTFARASTATVIDHEGLVRIVNDGEARWSGGRRVENLIHTSSEAINAGGWNTVASATIDGPNTFTTSSGAASCVQQYIGSIPFSGRTFSITAKIWCESGTSTARLKCTHAGVVDNYSSDLAITTTPQRFSFIVTFGAGGTGVISGVANASTGGVRTLHVTEFFLEDVTGQANQNPSEYVSVGVLSAPYHGANVDGVKYFSTENGNTVDGNGVITEATGPALDPAPRYLNEGQATNHLTYSEAFTNWIFFGGVTVTSNDSAAPNSTNTADKVQCGVTAFARIVRNTTYTFSGSTTYTLSCFVKNGNHSYVGLRITGDCQVNDRYPFVNLDTLSTNNHGLSGCTINIKAVGSSGWYYIWCTYTTQASPSSNIVDIALVDSSGDTTPTPAGTEYAYLWGAQLEQSPAPTSYIPTSGAAVTRSADALKYDRVGNVDETKGTLFIKSWVPGYSETLISTVEGLVAITDNSDSVLSLETDGDFCSYDGANRASRSSSFVSDNEYNLAVRWDADTSVFQAGYQDVTGAGSWQWGTEATFDGAFSTADWLHLFYSNAYPNEVESVKIYNGALTTAEIEAL